MSLKFFSALCGYLSIVVGALATMLIYRIQYMKIAMTLAILGFILASINIFLNVRHGFDEEKIPKGYLGIFFSSLPVIFLLLIVFKFRK